MKKNFKKYRKYFNVKKLFQSTPAYFQKAGVKLVYSAMLLFYAYKRSETPHWAKNIIIGVLGYLLLPIDAIPDLTPVLGLTDDLGVLSFGLVTIASYINSGVRIQAKEKITNLFGKQKESAFLLVDKML